MSENAVHLCVLVPTYRREGPLRWALGSLLIQDVSGLAPGRRRVVVLNNDVAHAGVDRAVRETLASLGARGWEVEVVHRDPPLAPALNWYGGMKDFSQSDDVVFLHGDDDLATPGSLAQRAEALVRTQGTVLIGRAGGSVLFREGEPLTAQVMDGPVRAAGEGVRPMTGDDLAHFPAPLITCHAYRNTAALWESYERAFQRMQNLPVPPGDRLGMLPLFLVVQCLEDGGGRVLDAVTCMRGRSEHDLFSARLGNTELWRAHMLYAVTYYLASQSDLAPSHDLAAFREQSAQVMRRFVVPSLYSGQIGEVLKLVGPLLARSLSPKAMLDFARGGFETLKALAGLSGLRTRLSTASLPRYRFEEMMRALGHARVS